MKSSSDDNLIAILSFVVLLNFEVINLIKKRPKLNHIVLTGRGAKEEILKEADLVTEMTLIKHPFREQGIKAQKGIEF